MKSTFNTDTNKRSKINKNDRPRSPPGVHTCRQMLPPHNRGRRQALISPSPLNAGPADPAPSLLEKPQPKTQVTGRYRSLLTKESTPQPTSACISARKGSLPVPSPFPGVSCPLDWKLLMPTANNAPKSWAGSSSPWAPLPAPATHSASWACPKLPTPSPSPKLPGATLTTPGSLLSKGTTI